MAKTQTQLMFRVPNTPAGQAFIQWAKTYLNTDSYRLKVRGVDGKSLNDKSVKTLRVYLVGKTEHGLKTVGINEANHTAERMQFYRDASSMKKIFTNLSI